MLKEKKIKIKDIDGVERTYIISRIPATYAREIFTQYITSAAPKIGNYKLNEELMFKLMSYVQVEAQGGAKIPLDSRDLIDNHVPDLETQLRIEREMGNYNVGFLQRASSSSFFSDFIRIMKELSTQTLTASSQQSKAKDEQQTTN